MKVKLINGPINNNLDKSVFFRFSVLDDQKYSELDLIMLKDYFKNYFSNKNEDLSKDIEKEIKEEILQVGDLFFDKETHYLAYGESLEVREKLIKKLGTKK